MNKKILGLVGIVAVGVVCVSFITGSTSAQTGATAAPSNSTNAIQSWPTFDFLRDHLSKMNKVDGRYTVNTKGYVALVTEAEKKHQAGKTEKAEQLLLKTVKAVHTLAEQGRLTQVAATNYESYVHLLIAQWKTPTPPPVENGGYPAQWANAPISSLIDNWGFYNRQAPSYAAFKVSQSGRYMPYGFGNSKDWPAKAQSLGIPVDGIPKKGDVAIYTGGAYGHAMYVEEVFDNGTIRVSEYNLTFVDGLYGERILNPATMSLQFIHFPYPAPTTNL